MTNSQRLATVRARLLQWLATEHGETASEDNSENVILRESILIRDEFYCGRRFHTAQHQAVWFIEEDELKIYNSTGELACVFSSQQIDAPLPSTADQDASPGDRAVEADSPHVIRLPAPAGHEEKPDGESRRAA